MSDLSDFLEAKHINETLRTALAAKPDAVYVALYTSPTDDAGGGTEVTGGSYARVQVPQADSEWSAPGVGGQTSNSNSITFPQATAGWGTVTHFALRDAVTGGNLLYHSALNVSRTINLGDTPSFAPGSLTVTYA